MISFITSQLLIILLLTSAQERAVTVSQLCPRPPVMKGRTLTEAEQTKLREFEQWQPGPQVIAEMKRLGELESQWKVSAEDSAERLTEAARERERLLVERHFTLLLAYSAARANPQADYAPTLAVIRTKDELRRIFPHGTKHCGEPMIAGTVCPASPGDPRKWRYLAKFKWDWWEFFVFEKAQGQ
ncbi:MAG TPA: hypothetical protein VFD58_00375 [Blastocatellia bacterium]|nr:hypothetical protein [Blastocatellia bacterium]